MGPNLPEMNSEQFDLMCFIQNLISFLASENSYVGKSPQNKHNYVNRSKNSLYYKVRAHQRLLEITENISKTIVESCSGIDEICHKVRECLEDAQKMGIHEPNLNTPFSHRTPSKSKMTNYETPELKSPTKLTSESLKLNNSEIRELNIVKSTDLPSFITMLDPSHESAAASKKHIQRIERRNATDKFIQSIRNDRQEIGNVVKKSKKKTNTLICNHKEHITEKVNEIIQSDIEELTKDLTNYRKNITTNIDEYDIDRVDAYIHEDIEELTKDALNDPIITTKTNGISTTEKRQKFNGSQSILNSEHSLNNHNLLSQLNSVEKMYFERMRRKDFKEMIPDVYRKPAYTDLYEKLLMQLEMNDSYICFQKLMNPTHKMRNKRVSVNRLISPVENRDSKVRLLADMKKNFNNSLWFSQRHLKGKSSSNIKKEKTTSLQVKKKQSAPTSSKKNISIRKKTRSNSQKSSIISLTNYSSTSSKCLKSSSTGRNSRKNSTVSTGILQTMSEICNKESVCKLKITNEKSISSEKRRLEWMKAKNLQAPIKKLECLDILDDLTIRDLQPIQSEYPRKDCNVEERNIAKYCYLTKLLQDSNQDTWLHLLQPSLTDCQKNNRISTEDYHKDSKLKEHSSFTNDAVSFRNDRQFAVRNYSREDVVKMLQPYMFDPQYCNSSVITVLPVHVYYDNLNMKKPTKQNINDKFANIPMEEWKNLPRARWILPETSKMKVKNTLKNNSDPTTPRKFSPNNFSQKSAETNGKSVRGRHSLFKERKEERSCNQKQANFKNGKMDCKQIEYEIEEQSKQRMELNMNTSQRKLWANKYGKSIGRQLIDFVQHQSEAPPEPIPKYMMPIITDKTPVKKRRSLEGENGNNFQEKNVLSHLKDLRNRNHSIQNNIEKTIDKIEHKMMNILSEPHNNKNNNKAFNSMEKEIANVLTMMRRTNTVGARKIPATPPKVTTPQRLQNMREDLDTISDELFKELEKILDDAGTSSESKTSITNKPKHESVETVLPDFGSSNLSGCNKEIHLSTNKNTGSETKHCISSFTAISGVGANEKIYQSNLNIPCGDQKILEVSQAFGTTQPETLLQEQTISPNSSGDYCENVTETLLNRVDPNKHILQFKITKENNYKTPDEIHEDSVTVIEKRNNQNTEEQSLKQIDFQKHIQAVETFEQIIKTDDYTDFVEEKDSTFHGFKRSEVFRPDDTEQTQIILKELADNDKQEEFEKAEDDLCKNVSSESNNNEITKDFPEKVDKIIKRVEDIYTQLEDIYIKDNYQNIPTFHNKEIVNITSEEFLTPFMKDLKMKRKSVVTSQAEDLQDGAFYDNVINCLESIERNFRDNTPIEEYFTRLCYLPVIQRTTEVKYVGNIEHTAIHVGTDKPSCLKKMDEPKGKKKVSFLVMTEEKGNQVEICPHHKLKLLKTSSYQFPPSDIHLQDLKNWNQDKRDTDEGITEIEQTMSNQKSIDKTISCNNDILDDICLTQEANVNLDCSNEFPGRNNTDEKSSEVINEYSEASETRSESLTQSKSSDPYILNEPQIKVYFDEVNKNNPQVVVKNILTSTSHQTDTATRLSSKKQSAEKPKIILFRELSNIGDMLLKKSLKGDHNLDLRNNSDESEQVMVNEITFVKNNTTAEDENTIILLKSIYAVVYILMFTALNLEYTCVYN